jgi:hypothetical protein
MQIQKVIEYLNQQRAMIDETISCLERLSEGSSPFAATEPAKRRGRKFMHEDDRQKVSERMKQYWASRRVERSHHAGSAI